MSTARHGRRGHSTYYKQSLRKLSNRQHCGLSQPDHWFLGGRQRCPRAITGVRKIRNSRAGGKLAKRRSTGSVNAPVPAHYTEGGDVSSHNPIDDGPIMGFGMSPNMAFHDYGLPERVSRQWVVDNTEPGEDLGVVPIPLEHRDGLFTHGDVCP